MSLPSVVRESPVSSLSASASISPGRRSLRGSTDISAPGIERKEISYCLTSNARHGGDVARPGSYVSRTEADYPRQLDYVWPSQAVGIWEIFSHHRGRAGRGSQRP